MLNEFGLPCIFFEGKTQKEIAEELNVTVNKVKNWRKGALKKIEEICRKGTGRTVNSL